MVGLGPAGWLAYNLGLTKNLKTNSQQPMVYKIWRTEMHELQKRAKFYPSVCAKDNAGIESKSTTFMHEIKRFSVQLWW